MVGSILRGSEGHLIPDEVRDLVEWMSPQRARKPKADATAGYFEDLTIALKEIGRVLVPGGRMAMVVSARHSFYELVSREVVRTLPLAETLGKMVEDPRFGIDLRLLDVVEIELPKMDFAARPQARGAYHEAIILCEKRQR